MSSELSSVIKFVRFPLIFFVVLIHSVLPIDKSIQWLFIDSVQRVVHFFSPVPPFFLISAFLFFYSFSSWEWDKYRDKLYKRVYSLLIPYLIWNFVVIIYFFILHRFFPSLINPNFENVVNFSLMDLVRAFWDGSGGDPIAYQLWFLRDLIVMTLLAPIFYLLMKGYLGWIVFILISFNSLFEIITIPHFCSITWFAIGAFLALHNLDFVQLLKKSKCLFVILYVVFVFATFISEYYKPFSDFFGVFAIFDISRILVNKGVKIPALLVESVYFIYLFHGFPVKILTRIIYNIFYWNEIMLVIGFFATPIIMVAVSVVIFLILRRYLPSFTNILIGKRLTK